MKYSDEQIILHLKKGKSNTLKYLFDLYYDELCRYAIKITDKSEIAEEIVQDVFVYIWKKRKVLEIKTSIKQYLFKAVKNKSINYLKSKYANIKTDTINDKLNVGFVKPFDRLELDDISNIAKAAIQNLPDKCSIIFNMSRQFSMTYKEIAESLDISPKTVENQIIIALRKIREYIDKYDK
jgi:RNA polymerase sigma-70 factor (ECF subfamily)